MSKFICKECLSENTAHVDIGNDPDGTSFVLTTCSACGTENFAEGEACNALETVP